MAEGCGAPEGVNPRNAMPQPNQQAAPGQRHKLSKDRVTSSIPGQDGAAPWVYPSPQMFFNAMRRKGFDPQERDMETVVAIHNTVNEQTWDEIRRWEALYPECLSSLRLLRFEGKPKEPTLKARMKEFVGYKPPFDRHDWVVERCGKEVRYLIDFYQGRNIGGKPIAMHIDARPAADDLAGVVHRVRGAVSLPPAPPFIHGGAGGGLESGSPLPGPMPAGQRAAGAASDAAATTPAQCPHAAAATLKSQQSGTVGASAPAGCPHAAKQA